MLLPACVHHGDGVTLYSKQRKQVICTIFCMFLSSLQVECFPHGSEQEGGFGCANPTPTTAREKHMIWTLGKHNESRRRNLANPNYKRCRVTRLDVRLSIPFFMNPLSVTCLLRRFHPTLLL